MRVIDLWRRLGVVVSAMVVAGGVSAATYCLDPVKGSPAGDGSADRPWSTLEVVLAAKKSWQAGDVLVLRSGFHGRPVVRGEIAGGEVLIRSGEGQTPELAALTFKGAAHWQVAGLTITPEGALKVKSTVQALVSIGADCHDITVRSCEIYSARSIAGWTEADWLARSITGIVSSGARTTLVGNRLRNVCFGITLGRSAAHSLVVRNVISDFMSDGLRGLADACVFESNTVRNCYKIDDNHDDGFQSWSGGVDGVKVGGGVVKDVVLRGNTFISYTDPAQPYKSAMQGIGCFDGMFENWTVENNLIVTDMWHGIAFLGAKNCRIINNTVIKNPIDAAPRTPWILVGPHKHGMPSTGNVVRNNLVQTLTASADVGAVDHNVVTKVPAAEFVNYPGFDFHLKPQSMAVGAGTPELAPAVDIEGHTRTPPVDAGAYAAAK